MSLESIQNFCSKENFAGNTHIECVPVQWIEDYPEFATDGHNFAQAITLKIGKSWLVFPCVSDTLDFRERERSTSHGVLDTPTISGFVPGDTPKIASVLNSAKANEWVVILYYKTGEAKVIGSPDYPSRFSSSLNNRGTLNSGKGYDIEFYSEGDFKTFFLEETPGEADTGCLPGVTNIINTNNTVVGTSMAPSGSAVPFIVPNSVIDVDGSTWSVPATDGLNLNLIDTEGHPVSSTQNGNDIIIDDLPTPLYYGVEWDITAATTVMTRIGNMDMHRTLPIQSQMKRALIKDDGSVNYWLDDNDSNLKADGVTPSNLSGDDGQVMVRLPEHYRKFENQVDKRRTLLSLHPLDGFQRVPERWVSAYEATVQRSTNKLSSVVSMDADYRGGNNNAAEDLSVISFLGKPASAISRINFRAYARNRGTMQWNMMLHEVRKTIFWLYYVEHANKNCQTAFNPAPTAEGYTQGGLGPGVTTVDGTDWANYNGRYPFVPCGITNSLGNNTGVVDYSPPGWPSPITVSVPSFRGIENPFGHLWEWIDGVNIRIQADSAGGQSEIYLADSLAMSDVDYVGYTKFNNLPRQNGYIHAIIHINGEILPRSVTGASSNTFWSDYFYTDIPSSGEVLRGVLSGGAAYHGSPAGLGYSHTYHVPTSAYAHVGSRLCFLPEGV